MQILIADDSRTNLAILTDALQKLGHSVIPAHNGQEAIQLFQEKRPDLIILDVMMEGLDGFACARKIRQLGGDEEWIPIIFLSSSTDDESIAKGIDAGGDDYLTKPFSDITLAAKIKAMQRIADMRQKLFDTTQKLYLLSSTDTLTGVYNRHQFDRSLKEILAAANRHHYITGLLFIDLDHFKNINDTFGHQVGDLLLIEVASRLKACVRSNDFIARLGGDEFAILLNEIERPEDAGNIAQKIVNTLSFDYNLDEHNIRSGASIGIACYPPSKTAEELILNADVAMYHAKATGRNNYQHFTEELNEKYKKQLNLEHALKFALERKEFFLTYQPIFDLKTRNIVGIETLLCWDHPQFGLVSPSIFIPIAEETGLIIDIGNWILRTACHQASLWPLDQIKNFKFAINISSRQLLRENFATQVMTILNDTGLSPQQLELELTETAMMTSTAGSFKEGIIKLHECGISISIDDFGTGYSSLTRLKHLPINTLKIDKSFIQDSTTNPNSAIIVNCLIALGKNLKLNVIAEGIETQKQLDFLIEKGCPQGQGFSLSRPVDKEQIEKLLKKQIYERTNSE